jgi:hypothetical protein
VSHSSRSEHNEWVTPRVRPLSVLVALSAAGLSALAGCGYQPVASDRLALGEQPVYAHCANPVKGGRDWGELQAQPTEFGLDDLVVRGDRPITVTKVDLVPRTTRLHLVDVAFVPLGGSVTSGFRFGDPKSTTEPGAWAKRLVLPATLTRLRPSAALEDRYPGTADQWQVVVAVQPTGENDTADAIALTYTVGGRTSVLVGRHSFAIAKTPADCTKDTGG